MCELGGPSLQDAEQQGVVHLANQLGGFVKGKPAGHEEIFVRVRVDNAPVPIPNCISGPGSTCPLSSFVQYVQVERAGFAGDFVERCGLTGVEGATSNLSFLTKQGDGTEMLVGMN